jgi:hypothetical protein
LCDELSVGEQDVRVEVEGELFRICDRVDRTLSLGVANRIREHLDPAVSDTDDGVADTTRSCVQLGPDRSEEAATRVDASLDSVEEPVGQAPEPLAAIWRAICRLDNECEEQGVRGFDRRELKLLLRPEVRVHTARAHPDRVGKATNGKAVEAFDRRELRSLVEDRLSAANSVASSCPVGRLTLTCRRSFVYSITTDRAEIVRRRS